MEKKVIDLLKKHNLKVSFAESCTCGLLASKIGNVPGASSVFNESYITYANEAKSRILGVKETTLHNCGAVSKETAEEMAKGLYTVTNADVCISVTGIAGPGGGTAEKPVGLVYIAVLFKNNITVHKMNYSGNRQFIRESVCNDALKFIINTIKENYHD